MKFDIAVVQFRTWQWQPEDNLRRAGQFVAKATRAGADIQVAPDNRGIAEKRPKRERSETGQQRM